MVAAHLPQRGGIDEIEMPPDQFRKVIFGPGGGEPLK